MKNKEKIHQKRLRDTKYFKWGLTAFLVIIASICFVFSIFNADKIYSGSRMIFKIFTPIIDGFIIAYLLNPIVKFFEYSVFEKYYKKRNLEITSGRQKRKRIFSIIITFILVASLLYAFFGTVLPQLYLSIESIIIHFPTYYNNVVMTVDDYINNSDLVKASDIQELFNTYSVDINNFITSNILPNVKDILKTLSSGLVNALSTIFNLIIGFIIAIYLIGSKEKYIGMCKKILYSTLPRQKVNNILVDLRFVNKTFGGFLVGKIVDSIIIGILCFIGLNIMHTPYAVLVSVIVGITNIIPFFGPYLGAIPSAFLILIVDPRQCLIFLIFVLILQQLDGNIIGPAILGNSIGVSSFWIIVSITVFGGFFGVPGMIVGVPLFACVYAFIRRRVNNRLSNKKLSINTLKYAETKYIDDKNNFVLMEHVKSNKDIAYDTSSPEYKRNLELNPSQAFKSDAKTDKWYIKLLNAVGQFFMDIYSKIKTKSIQMYNDKTQKTNTEDLINNNELINDELDINNNESNTDTEI